MYDKSTSKLQLSFLDTSINLISDNNKPIDLITNFFETHFQFDADKTSDDAIATLRFHSSFPDEIKQFDWHHAEEVWLRKSANPFFSHSAQRVLSQEKEYLNCEKSGSVIVLNKKTRQIDMYLGAGDYELEVIELLRDLIFKNCERQGILVLHSTCVEKDGFAYLVVGRKGAGKSTIAMDLVRNQGFTFLSGDKAFVFLKDGQPYVCGWPDYPHFGMGTIKNDPGLLEISGIANIDERHSQEKVPLHPNAFRKIVPHSKKDSYPIQGVLYPQIDPNADAVLTPLQNHQDRLLANIEHAFTETSTWNCYIDSNCARSQPILDVLAQSDANQFIGITVPNELVKAS